MQLGVLFLAVAAGIVIGDVDNGGGVVPGRILLSAGLGGFGLLALRLYFNGRRVIAEARAASLDTTGGLRPPIEESPGRGVFRSVLMLVGCALGAYGGYAAYQSLQPGDGGSAWEVVIAAVLVFVVGIIRNALLPAEVKKAVNERLRPKEVIETVNEEPQRSTDSIEERLDRLDALRDSGGISAEEHARERERILGEL